jgi:hypothetical protein
MGILGNNHAFDEGLVKRRVTYLRCGDQQALAKIAGA